MNENGETTIRVTAVSHVTKESANVGRGQYFCLLVSHTETIQPINNK